MQAMRLTAVALGLLALGCENRHGSTRSSHAHKARNSTVATLSAQWKERKERAFLDQLSQFVCGQSKQGIVELLGQPIEIQNGRNAYGGESWCYWRPRPGERLDPFPDASYWVEFDGEGRAVGLFGDSPL
jgi:hypothetical protein